MRRAALDAFEGFPGEAQTFLGELRDNNTREWFTAQRARHERLIKAPAEAFVAALAPRLASLAGKPVTGKIFRVHCDVRFSHDKSPYNAHLHVLSCPRMPRPAARGFTWRWNRSG